MDATPALFGPTQSPLVAIHLHQAPVSLDVAIVLLNWGGTGFHRLASNPVGPRSPRGSPLRSQAIHLLSIRLRRVKSTASCGVDATPALFRPAQSPLVAIRLHQAPLSIGVPPLPEHLYVRPGWAELSSAFADSRSVVFALRRPFADRGLTTLLSIALSRCRPTACSVCTLPLALRVGKDPLAASPGSHCCTRLLGTSLSPEPWRLSPSAYLGFRRQAFNLAVLRATWATRRIWPHLAPHPQVWMLPLLTVAQQCFLIAYHPISGSPSDSACSG